MIKKKSVELFPLDVELKYVRCVYCELELKKGQEEETCDICDESPLCSDCLEEHLFDYHNVAHKDECMCEECMGPSI